MHKVLLVDDTRHFLELETTFLQRAECRVLTAGTGLEALRVAKNELPDLILLDIEMPEMNGLQACRILKSDPATKAIPVIMLTSMKMEGEARRAGADHYLRKPIDEPTFLAEIRKFLAVKERAETRVSLEAPITLWHQGEPTQGKVMNLSRTGFFVSTRALRPVGARLEVSFPLSKDPTASSITAEALVVWVSDQEPYGFGCRFFQVSATNRQSVEAFLEENAGRPRAPHVLA